MKKLVSILIVLSLSGSICFAALKSITHVLLYSTASDPYIQEESTTTSTPRTKKSVVFTSQDDLDEYLSKNFVVDGVVVDVISGNTYKVTQTEIIVTKEVEEVTGYNYSLIEE